MTKVAVGNWRLPAFITLWVVTVVGWLPFALVLSAGLFATAFGCVANEGDAHPCVVAGYDFGELIYIAGVSGWFMLVTWPLMLITLVVWIALAAVAVTRRFTKTVDAPQP
jgi:hypothetical protein